MQIAVIALVNISLFFICLYIVNDSFRNLRSEIKSIKKKTDQVDLSIEEKYIEILKIIKEIKHEKD